MPIGFWRKLNQNELIPHKYFSGYIPIGFCDRSKPENQLGGVFWEILTLFSYYVKFLTIKFYRSELFAPAGAKRNLGCGARFAKEKSHFRSENRQIFALPRAVD